MRTKARTAQCLRRNADAGFIAGKDGPGADSAARSLSPSDHGRAAAATCRLRHAKARRRGCGANGAFTLPGEKSCALEAALLKGALETCEGYPVTPTVEAPTFADPVSQAPRS